MTAITIALKYSTLPCPKGCALSGSFFDSFAPIIVTTELATSEALFTASSTMAMELVISPIAALNTARNTLATIPTILV